MTVGPLQLKPRGDVDERVMRVQAINGASAVASREMATRVEKLTHALTVGVRHDFDSRRVANVAARYEAALDALDELVAIVRPALEEAHRTTVELAGDLAEEERQAAELADQERRRADVEGQVADAVAKVEADRLAAVEASVRRQLTGASS